MLKVISKVSAFYSTGISSSFQMTQAVTLVYQVTKGPCCHIQFQENESWASFFSLKEEIYGSINKRSTHAKINKLTEFIPQELYGRV